MNKRIKNTSTTKTRRRALRKSQTDVERKMWSILRNKQINGLKFYRQYSIDPYILDFFCPAKRLAIELDGGHHAENNHKQRDEIRTLHLAQQHIHVLRFWNNEVRQNLEGVWQKIQETIKGTPS